MKNTDLKQSRLPDETVLKIVLLAALAILLAITIVSAARTVHDIGKAIRSGQVHEINDFDRWMRLIPNHLVGHADIVNERSANTPLDMLLLMPFTHLSRPGAHVAWAVC